VSPLRPRPAHGPGSRASGATDVRLRALGLRHARLIVPWDAATSEPEAVQAWLDATAAGGMEPHVAFTRSSRAPARPAPWSPGTSWTRARTSAGCSASRPRPHRARGCGACTTTATRPTSRPRAPTRSSATRPRITRLYVNHWQGRAGDRFDAGLIRPDGSLRPSYWRLATHLAGQAAVTSTKIPAPRWRASWSKVDRSRLRLTVSCRATGRRCRGTVTLRVHGRKVATRRYTTTVARGAQTLRVTVPKRVRQQFRRAKKPRIVLTVRSTAPAGATATVTLRVARPKAP